MKSKAATSTKVQTHVYIGSLTIYKSPATMSKLSQTNRTLIQKRSKKANENNNKNPQKLNKRTHTQARTSARTHARTHTHTNTKQQQTNKPAPPQQANKIQQKQAHKQTNTRGKLYQMFASFKNKNLSSFL